MAPRELFRNTLIAACARIPRPSRRLGQRLGCASGGFRCPSQRIDSPAAAQMATIAASLLPVTAPRGRPPKTAVRKAARRGMTVPYGRCATIRITLSSVSWHPVNRVGRAWPTGRRPHLRAARAGTSRRSSVKQTKTRNLLQRFNIHRDAVLLLMRDFRAPFTNNPAERDVRTAKGRQEISGTFRSEQGVKVFCRSRSYILTLKKQGLPAFEYIQQGPSRSRLLSCQRRPNVVA